MTRTSVVLGLLAAGNCGERDRHPVEGGEATSASHAPAAAAPAPERFVVFTAPTLIIDRLGVPVAAPVTVGSAPGPDTMSSDAPEIVGIDATGKLVAHRNGRAAIRTLNGRGAVLRVDVRAVSALAVVPPRLVLRPGGAGQLRLVAGGSGEPIPPEAAQWGSDAPGVAVVIAGTVEAADRVGTANVLVTYGGQSARAVVSVERPRQAEVQRPTRSRQARSDGSIGRTP